jgi:VanZ family protein
VRVPERWFRAFWTVVTIAVAVFIFYQSTGGSSDPGVPDLSTTQAYVGHVGVYAVLGFCAQTALLSRRWQTIAGAIIVAGLFGAGLELYQSTLEGREASVYDAIANLTGAILGSLVAVWFAPNWRRFVVG